jgi:transposase
MVLGCVEGWRIKDLAIEISEQQDVIIKWRDRFIESGLPGLLDKGRTGKPVTYGDAWKIAVLEKLDEKPPYGRVRWDGPTLAAELDTSPDAVQRFLQKEGILYAVKHQNLGSFTLNLAGRTKSAFQVGTKRRSAGGTQTTPRTGKRGRIPRAGYLPLPLQAPRTIQLSIRD